MSATTARQTGFSRHEPESHGERRTAVTFAAECWRRAVNGVRRLFCPDTITAFHRTRILAFIFNAHEGSITIRPPHQPTFAGITE
jgi:hypothetical protein